MDLVGSSLASKDKGENQETKCKDAVGVAPEQGKT